ncbi:Exocyst complex component S5 [Saxophila tyrrhenica]|uniref:Exocyst complex component SEC5 n=1 Tax=Saxophila tyrrhenica TaxID=1690608 RepID=A0AAV9PU57_9PEZI|nr:Exocyst complex component S5 [Saxophila tyrrhenica]
MPVSAQTEQRLLQHYGLTRVGTLYPDAWPHQDDDSSGDEEDDIEAQQNNKAINRQTSKLSGNSRSSYSKYRNIDRHASIRSGTTTSESLVQQDEADPLGKASSVASELKQRGLPVEENLKLRNRFMLSSTTFSPALFLSQVHQDASTQDLLRGLDTLSQSIEQKSASLKVLVESNFEKFVRAKATIDNVYKEMRDQGADVEGQQAGRRPHSRHASRQSVSHFRNTSGPFSPTNKPLPSDKKKNALTKESEYGVQGIKAPLVEVAIKAEEVWGPAIGGREKEETLKAVVSNIESHKDIFRLSGNLHESIRKSDYDGIAEAWKQAKKYADQARNIAEIAEGAGGELKDSQAQFIIVTAKTWHHVTQQIEDFKRDVWRKLKSSHGRKPAAVSDETDKEEHMELIGVLLQLGVDENPIWEWLHSRYVYLKDKIARSFERSRIEIEILRRKIANGDQTDVKLLARHLRSVSDSKSLRAGKDVHKDMDTPAVLAFWEKVQTSVTGLLSSQHGVLGEVLEYWEIAQSFIDNKAQRNFPTPVFAAGIEQLELEPDDVQNLRAGAVELINLLRENIFAFFSDDPVEDLSDLYSPIPPTPITPAPDSSSPASFLTPTAKRAFTFDPATIPPPSPRRGDAWEKFAFWPPAANSLSGSYHLARLLVLVGTAASEMASLPLTRQARLTDSLRSLVAAVRERSLQAVVAAWSTDADRVKWMENWQRSPQRNDLTLLPEGLKGWEEWVVEGVQKIAYVSEANAGREEEGVVGAPSAKLLTLVRQAFVGSLYKALSGMVECAEKDVNKNGEDGEEGGVVVNGSSNGSGEGNGAGIGSPLNQNTRKLLTLSNLTHLRIETLPHLLSHFEAAFSLKLTDESAKLRDVLSQIESRLFDSYISPTTARIDHLVSSAISSPNWAPAPTRPSDPARPTDAKPYIYDVLLTLVLAHSEISTTAPALLHPLISHALEKASESLLAAFQARTGRYSLSALMQATLDVEFLAQTLNHFTSDKAGEVQSRIYLALDERTDNEARAKLQAELPEMRGALKKLREGSKGVYGCFRRERGQGGRGRGGSSRG